KLRQRPDDAHRQQHPAGLHPVDQKAGRDRRDREQQEETGTDQSELARTELQLLHNRNSGDPDNRLVGEIDQHENEEQHHHDPSAVAVVSTHWTSPPPPAVVEGWKEDQPTPHRISWRSDSACSRIELGTTKAGVSTFG